MKSVSFWCHCSNIVDILLSLSYTSIHFSLGTWSVVQSWEANVLSNCKIDTVQFCMKVCVCARVCVCVRVCVTWEFGIVWDEHFAIQKAPREINVFRSMLSVAAFWLCFGSRCCQVFCGWSLGNVHTFHFSVREVSMYSITNNMCACFLQSIYRKCDVPFDQI